MSGEQRLGPSPAQIATMGKNIAARIEEVRKRRRRRRRAALAAGGVGVAAALTAAGVLVTASPPEVQASAFACYSEADLSSSPSVIGYPSDWEPPTDARGRVAAALELCGYLYDTQGIAVADPTVCELRDLRLAVLPNERGLDDVAFCAALGLGPSPD